MKRARGFTLIELMIVIAIIAILIGLMAPNFMRARSQAQVTACQSNLKTIATSVEQYSADYQSRYPSSITILSPHYIKTLPTCPACSFGYSYAHTTVPDAYTVWCGTAQAHSMSSIPDGFPQYNSANGMINQ